MTKELKFLSAQAAKLLLFLNTSQNTKRLPTTALIHAIPSYIYAYNVKTDLIKIFSILLNLLKINICCKKIKIKKYDTLPMFVKVQYYFNKKIC